MNFGKAIEALKEGKKVARAHWGDHDAFIYITKGRELTEARDDVPSEIIRETGSCNLCDHIDMAEGRDIICGWSPTQNDILAEDWRIIA